MVIYKIIKDYRDLKKGTSLTFNKSKQRFETFKHESYITNNQSAQNPGLIIIHKVLTRQSEAKHVWTIPF